MERCKKHKELDWDDKDCDTCKSVRYHNSIYGGLNNEEKISLFKKRTSSAFKDFNK